MFAPEEQSCIGHSIGNLTVETYCEAIQQLLDEHLPLRTHMEKLAARSKNVVDLEVGSRIALVRDLVQLEGEFKQELEAHSGKEEEGLFVILGRHIGTESGPIAVMEYEHNIAKTSLGIFEQRSKILQEELPKEEVEWVITPLVQAVQILNEHFMKEENVLFPMAEKLLTADEKEELLKIVKL